jgi:signal transduction histidine kinase
MARLYLTLYGILFVAFALFYGSLVWVPDLVLHGSVQRYFERVMFGAYYLAEEKLHETTPEHWDQVIDKLEPHFPHGLELTDDLEPLDLSESEKARLQQGDFIFFDEGEQTRFYKQVDDSGRYLMIALGASPEQEERDQSMGIVYLIESRFLSTDEADWPALKMEMASLFDLPSTMLALDSPELPADRIEEIESGKLIVLGLEEGAETYFKRIGNTQWVFRAGPFVPPPLLRYFNHILFFALALIIALAVYIWVRPVWRDLKRVDRSVRHFGDGDLATRLEVRKGSALKPLADTFNAMAERMQRLIHSHKELTGAVSHELRTPIARLRFRVDMLNEPLNSNDFERHLTAMRKDIVELEELVSESLSYSRFDRERPDLVLEAVDLNGWLANLMAELGDELLAVDIQLKVPGRHAVGRVKLDTRLMARAVKNLLRNAHRHASQRIQLSYTQTNDLASIVVEDDGSGVPEQDRERIFAPFARLDAARDRESGGVGLGLAIVSQIARWHSGKVWVEDGEMGGARFVIQWPVT